jgi:hypothetical protein
MGLPDPGLLLVAAILLTAELFLLVLSNEEAESGRSGLAGELSPEFDCELERLLWPLNNSPTTGFVWYNDGSRSVRLMNGRGVLGGGGGGVQILIGEFKSLRYLLMLGEFELCCQLTVRVFYRVALHG